MGCKLTNFFIAIMLVAMASQAATADNINPEGTPVSLDSCRAMAVNNNIELRIARESVNKAGYSVNQAKAAYLPGVDFAGGYMYNQKKISIFDSDQMLPVKSFSLETGKYEFDLVKNPMTGEPIKGPDGQYVPSSIALIPKEAMEYDIHNVFFGAVTITQPIYMGGKIKAMNEMARQAQSLAEDMQGRQAQELIYNVDAAYWQVVSLKAKYRLATGYVELLDTLRMNVDAMVRNGVATRADLLSVEVKLNQAQVDLTKVENGVSLSRMALAHVCGLPVNTVFPLVDEDLRNAGSVKMPASSYNMDEVYNRRYDLRALETGVRIYEQEVEVAKSAMLPNLALVGSYSFSNPNMFNGFKKRFNGSFSVGAMLTIPLWHWGGNYNKYLAAKSEVTIGQLKLENAREMIDLQVSQAAYKTQEAIKTYNATKSNLAKANENLRRAELGFREGVMTVENVMEAQTAWLKANSENIDAMIDIQLCNVYLSKVLGLLN